MAIKNVVFDYGGVLVDWNRRHLYDKYFEGDKEKEEFFLENICPYEWNTQFDAGRDFMEGVEERAAEFPQWKQAIMDFYYRWDEMLGEQIPGMEQLLKDLMAAGYRLYGLTNWSAQTFPYAYYTRPVFQLIDHVVVSGTEKVKKPDIRIYKILLDRYKLNPDETIYTDDNSYNLTPAESLGMHTHLFIDADTLRKLLL